MTPRNAVIALYGRLRTPQRAPDLGAALGGLAGSQEIVVCEFERREVGPNVLNLTRR